MKEKQYDGTLSFTGEDRPYAEQLGRVDIGEVPSPVQPQTGRDSEQLAPYWSSTTK